ncbi:FAD binding domain-containing protein [Dongia rigui]|uniref:Xanthine dehydrogenase family protein subunit M n=1 Tax=Dongia rigui TaxID=940149 RepID=A0ABU5DU36_9PROT|nr:xanthine dehydrogenase family protein subunit M [Dongia rigui]MDY0870718.1 xanthine dehydrogenase family protein subunit M [Dongia rigui]
MHNFAFHRPASTADAVKALGSASDGKIIAGGQTLLPTLRQRLASPSDLVDLGAIADLKGIKAEGDGLTIGAMTTHAEVASSAIVQGTIPALAHLAAHIGDRQVRARGTIGGSLANNDPAADYPAAVLGLGATIRTNKREIKADDYFQGMFSTALADGEIITAVHFPKPEKAGYEKFVQPASRFALVGVFVAKTKAGVRVAVTGAGQEGVFRAKEVEAALANFTADAAKGAKVPAGHLNTDLHGSAEYRAHLISVLAGRAVAAAK